MKEKGNAILDAIDVLQKNGYSITGNGDKDKETINLLAEMSERIAAIEQNIWVK